MQLRTIGKALGGIALKEMIRSSFNFGHINFEINISGDVEYGWILDIRLLSLGEVQAGDKCLRIRL